MHKLRRLTGVLAAIALPAAGCGGTTAHPSAGASSIVPASAPAYISIDADPSSQQWRTIDELAGKFPDKQKAIDSIKNDMRKDDVEWDRDVKPVLQGELDFAWLDFENNGQNFVMLMQPKKDAKFRALVEKANRSEKNPSDRVVYEKFRGWEVLAGTRDLIDRFKRTSRSEARSLAGDKTFNQAMDRLGKDAVVRAFVSGKFVMSLARKYGGGQLQPYIDKVGTLDWAALRFGATSEGVGVDTIVHGTPGSLFKDAAKSPAFSPKLLGTVPANALLSISFKGTKNMFGGLQQNSQLRQFTQPLHQLGRILEGENALYVRPGRGRLPEVTLVSTPKSDGMAILDRLVKRFAGASPHESTIDGTPVHALPASTVGVYYANIGGKLVVTDQPEGIRGAKDGRTPLSESTEFKDARAAAGAPDKTWGLLYVNISSSVPYVERVAGQHIPAEIARNLKPLRSAVEYAASHTHELQLSFFLRIK
ncbi:MAG TPA: hypothetical protein VNR59_11895 [Gaiellaceae bacterium]|nr:hypothetical protein [Gaiellaceae bacterium]